MGRRILEGGLERGVADQELRVGLLAERHVRRRRGRSTFVSTTEVADSGVTATARISLERQPRDELDRVDRALRGDAEPRQEQQRVGVTRVLDRGDRRGVDLARDQPPVELGRDAGDLLELRLDPEEDGRHVRVGDPSEPDHAARLAAG